MRRPARAAALAGLCIAAPIGARAETMAERASAVLAEVCLPSTSPSGLLAAAEGAARRYGWTLNARQSGAQRGFIPIEQGKAVAITWRKKVWDFVGRDGAGGSLTVQVLASGQPGRKFDTCQVAVPGDLAGAVEAEVGRQVSLGAKSALADTATGWVLSGDPAQPAQGYRMLGVSVQEITVKRSACTQEAPCENGNRRRITAAGTLDIKTAGAGKAR